MTTNRDDRFDRWLENIREPAGRSMVDALAQVTDTAHGVTLWFKDHQLEASAADIVSMTALILARDAELKRRWESPTDQDD